MTSKRLFNSFIPPTKNFYSPKTNFWLRPWVAVMLWSPRYASTTDMTAWRPVAM